MNDEIRKEAEERVLACYEEVKKYEPGSKEAEHCIAEAEVITKQLMEADRTNFEYYDKEQRRRIEEDRNRMNAVIEQDKNDVNWKRMLLELLKVGVPLLTVLYQAAKYGEFQDKLLHFEETGKVTSTAGREHHLPKFWR